MVSYCKNFCHAIYATLRNGLWEDPVEATRGKIFETFKATVEEQGLGKSVAPYLTWRYCYMKCSLFFGALYAIAIGRNSQPDIATYEKLLQQLPDGITKERFDSFFVALACWDAVMLMLWVATFVILAVATFFAYPTRAVQRLGVSRKLVWASWLTSFATPLVFLVTFPLRSLVDWTGIEHDICTASVLKVLNVTGVDVGSALSGLAQQGLVTGDVQSLSQHSEESIREWCKKHEDDWHQIFFESVACVWPADHLCRDTLCANVPASAATACQTQCINYSQSSPELTSDVFGSFSTCTSSDTGQASVGDQSATFDALAKSQQDAAELVGKYSNVTIAASEYTVGVLSSVRTAALLFATSLSVLSGLAESILNIKVIFPGTQDAPWLLLLTTFQALPIYCALLAVTHQLLGDHFLSIANILTLTYISLAAFTGVRALHFKAGVQERWRFYKRVWIEYALRGLFGTLAVVFFLLFIHNSFGSVKELLVLLGMSGYAGLVFFNYYARKSLLAVAGTDALLSAFLQSEFWRMAWPVADRESFELQVEELGAVQSLKIDRERHEISYGDEFKIQLTKSEVEWCGEIEPRIGEDDMRRISDASIEKEKE